MKKIVSLIGAIVISLVTLAETINLTFSGVTTEGRFCLLDSVKIENISQQTVQVFDLTEDSVVQLSVKNTPTGFEEIDASKPVKLITNLCTSSVDGTLFTINPIDNGLVWIRIMDQLGRIILDHQEYLDAGAHQYVVNLNHPNVYILSVQTATESEAIQILSLGQGGYCDLYRVTSLPRARRTAHVEYIDISYGDEMRYIGYTNQRGNAVASEPVTQYQNSSEHISLRFAPANKSQEGMYVSILGFNNQLFNYNFDVLTANNLKTHQNYVSNLQIANGTILYHAVYTALDNIIKAPIPQKLENVSLVTFTDGLDIGSWRMNSSYPSEALYLSAVNKQINRTYIDGIKLDAYAIGVKGSDVTDIVRFENDLHQLASDSANVYSVSNMDEVNARFREIAAKIYNRQIKYTLTIQLPAPDPGSVIRFTFDNVSDANQSIYYIEGTYNFVGGKGILTDVIYSGVRCANGATWTSTPSGIFDIFTLKEITNNLGERLDFNSMKQWTYIPTTKQWQINSEFNPSSNTTTSEERSSAIVMLVLDCSSSLSTDANKMKTAANNFLSILAGQGNIAIPSVSNGSATLGDLQATLTANITNTGNLNIIDQGFYVSKYINMDSAVCYQGSLNQTTIQCVVSQLVEGVTYYYRPYATNQLGTAYGKQNSFIAIAHHVPSIATVDISEITISSAVVTCEVTFDGYASVTERGFCWSTSSMPTIADNTITAGTGIGTFTGSITRLKDNTTYYVRAYAKNNKGVGYGAEKTFTTLAIVPPTVAATQTSSITISSAVVTSEVTFDGYASVTEQGFCWSTSSMPTIADNTITAGTGTGTFTGSITGLQDNTTYYVRAYAKNNKGVGYGAEKTFTTLAIVPPTVAATQTSSITISSAVVTSEVTFDGYASVTERGFCWSTSSMPTIADNTIKSGTGTGTFTGSITGLQDNTTYYVRAYAKNNKGVGYGAEKTFTTLAIVPPTVVLSKIDDQAAGTVTFYGNVTADGFSSVTERGFCWGTSSKPTIANSCVKVGSGVGSYSKQITNLVDGQTYYVRAYAKNVKGISYSAEQKITKKCFSIIYTAQNKLLETTNSSADGLHTNAFNVALSSHTFSNGKGTLIFSGEVTLIGDSAFFGCSGLTSVTIGNSVTTIGDYAFRNCSGLTSVTIGNSVTTIGTKAFMNCSGLTKTNYTGTIADWCKITFSDNYSNPIDFSENFYINDIEVKKLVIPAGVEKIGSYAFLNCKGLTSVTIPNSVTTIGSSAFEGCSSLTSVTIGNSITMIGSYAFSDCSGLTSVTIPNSVTTIGHGAFYYCSGLTSVTIPNSVTTIGMYAFKCSGLKQITCKATTPPSCSWDCFYDVSKSIPVYVPANSVSKYKAANVWKEFTNIQAIK